MFYWFKFLFPTSTRGIQCTAGKRGGHGLHCGSGGEYLRALQQPDKSFDGKGPREIHWTFKCESATMYWIYLLSSGGGVAAIAIKHSSATVWREWTGIGETVYNNKILLLHELHIYLVSCKSLVSVRAISLECGSGALHRYLRKLLHRVVITRK